jgi:hypothetical protein
MRTCNKKISYRSKLHAIVLKRVLMKKLPPYWETLESITFAIAGSLDSNVNSRSHDWIFVVVHGTPTF